MLLRYVFALGGNAFSRRNIATASKAMVSLYRAGNEVAITHGNGPQVGRLYLKEGKNLAILTGETERSLGKEIKNALLEEYHGARIKVIRTKTLVDANDKEFRNPTKPIGKYYDREEDVPTGRRKFAVRRLEKGYRLAVPSPFPEGILEIKEIRDSLSRGSMVIAAGGGGMAVVRENGRARLADAVVDKDLASAVLAKGIRADRLLILTDVDGAYLNYGAGNQKLLKKIKLAQAKRYLMEGHFEAGSMLPKVEACIEFASTGKIAAIGSISRINEVIRLESTVILP